MNEGRSGSATKAAPHESLDEDKEDREGDFTPAVLTDWRKIPSEALEKKRCARNCGGSRTTAAHLSRVLVLRDLEELNQEETASALGINVTLVKVGCTGRA